MSVSISNVRPEPDRVLVDIADYVTNYKVTSSEALDTAGPLPIYTLGCGFEALPTPPAQAHGAVVPTVVPTGLKSCHVVPL